MIRVSTFLLQKSDPGVTFLWGSVYTGTAATPIASQAIHITDSVAQRLKTRVDCGRDVEDDLVGVGTMPHLSLRCRFIFDRWVYINSYVEGVVLFPGCCYCSFYCRVARIEAYISCAELKRISLILSHMFRRQRGVLKVRQVYCVTDVAHLSPTFVARDL